MRKRTLSREIALKILYASEITSEPVMESFGKFWEDEGSYSEEVRSYAETLVLGVGEHMREIDSAISDFAANWEIGRMATIDRNIIRIAAYELMFLDEVPPKVAINEAIEIAKKYGDKDSGKFVNGILDRISRPRFGEQGGEKKK
jgi:transcription antitermination factor NusB